MKWRVRETQQLDQPGRTLFDKMLCADPLQAGNKRRRVPGQPNREEIGTPLMTPRQRVPERHRRDHHPPST